ncbi:hypothetical protein Solca_2128 [Solitalea canadensis DSM 3403]|uniref:Uncharacterized protein n=1 Tax=Solitalea canadensis (strain ATCC 29591 / DSM 3403 / JCM 21819 / LMG 8368 / NBRC 15130 / NCIMB 12057 / USAM 9D) TaxID=929556 RepID=H8KU70_SOLCM|nr:hypothetical protein Solca_2128 [Solitalea canadensis DSM 3403]
MLKMSKPWTINNSRRVIAILLIVFAVIFFWTFIKGNIEMFRFFVSKGAKINTFDYSLIMIQKYFAVVILYILTLIAGITLLIDTKIGWILSLTVLSCIGIMYIYRLYFYQNVSVKGYIIMSLVVCCSWGFFGLLLTKLKYTERNIR